MSPEHLMQYNREGLIPGPTEEEVEFLKRVNYCRQLREETGITQVLDDEKACSGPTEALEEGFAKTSSLYGIRPAWIPLFFSNSNLAPWHGGCAWIFQKNDETPTASLLQLRKAFHTRKKYLGIYDRQELIAHELVHAGRMMFEEPKFEEILAYRTASSGWRRWFGPLLQSANETLLFVLFLALIVILDFYLLGAGHFELYYQWIWLKMIPVGFLAFLLIRLGLRQWRFNSCLSRLTKMLDSQRKAYEVIYRLTDQEIISFAKMKGEEILNYAQQQDTLRWRLLSWYFFDKNRTTPLT